MFSGIKVINKDDLLPGINEDNKLIKWFHHTRLRAHNSVDWESSYQKHLKTPTPDAAYKVSLQSVKVHGNSLLRGLF